MVSFFLRLASLMETKQLQQIQANICTPHVQVTSCCKQSFGHSLYWSGSFHMPVPGPVTAARGLEHTDPLRVASNVWNGEVDEASIYLLFMDSRMLS